MHLLKQSTAATDTVGPILDSTGAEYTGAVIGDLSISKNGTEAAMAAAATLTHISNGMYTLVFTTGNTDTLGRLVIRCNKSTYQMPPVRYEVLAATTFDAIVTNAAGAANGMVYNGSNTGTVIPTVTTVTNQLTAAQVATGIWQDTTSGDFTVASSIGKSLYTTGNAPGAASGLALVGSNMGTITGALTAAQIATGVWQDTTAGDFTVASSIGKTLYIANIAPGAANGLAIVGSAMTLAASQHVIVDSGTVTTVTNQLTAAQIATGVWQDTTAGDFTTALSVGKSIMNGVSLGTGLTVARCTLTDTLTTYTGNTVQTGDSYARIGAAGVGLTSVALASSTSDAVIAGAVWNAATATYGTAGSYGLLLETDLDATISSRLASASYTAPSNLTAAQIATGVWQDATAGDFTTANSVGKSLYNAFTAGTSVFTTASLVNAPTGGSAPTVSQIATAVWQDTTAGDFTVASSIGKALYIANIAPGAANGHAIVGSNMGTTTSLTGDAYLYLTTNVGLLGANLTAADDAVIAAIAALNNLSSANVSSAVVTALGTALTEAYRTAGSTGSVAQLLYEISAHLGRAAISSVTKTLKKVDGSTTGQTYTLDSATVPTSIAGPN